MQDNNGFVPNDHGNGQKKFPDQGYIPLKDYEKAFTLAATPGNYRVSLELWED